jgi:hypothetical protein
MKVAKLIKCAGCGAEISKKAKTCPHCGEPISKPTSLFTWLLLVLIVVGIIGSLSPDKSSSSVSSSVSNQEKIAKLQRDKEEEKQQQEKTKDTKYFSQSKEVIVKDINLKIQNKKYNDAIKITNKYPLFKGKDNKISKIHTEVIALLAKEKKEKQTKHKKEILKQLKGISSSEYAKNKQLYQTLSRYEPNNKTYKEKVKFYSEKIKKEKEDKRLAQLGLKWNYQESKEKMGRGTIRNAYVKSINKLSFDFPYQGLQRATLQLRKHPKYGKDVIVSIGKGQFVCNSYSGCKVFVRFDSGKPIRYNATEPSDHSSTYIFIRNYKSFVSRAKKSKKIYIEAEFYQEGNRVMEFDSEGLKF